MYLPPEGLSNHSKNGSLFLKACCVPGTACHSSLVILVKIPGMRHLTDEETEQRCEVTCRRAKRWESLLASYHPKGLPGPEYLSCQSSDAWCPQPCVQALAPCLLILLGCDLEQLQTQPWVWPLALWPGCKVQGEQDLSVSCCLKGPQALPRDGNQVQWQNEGQSPGFCTPCGVLFPPLSGEGLG